MRMRNQTGELILVMILLLNCISILYAGETGKISGVITDKGSGEPLPGVNVQVQDTHLGGASDSDGTYFILHLRPGVYTLVFSFVGYAETHVEDIHVSVDHTTRVSIALEPRPIEGEEVVVQAERAVIQKDVTSSTQIVGIQELEQLPISDAREGIFLQTGVFFDDIPLSGRGARGESRYAIRGGAQDEVKWYVDGVRTASQLDARADQGGSFTGVNLNAIEEVQVVAGGFNAEYGEAQSGIVNVITKEGGETFSGSAEIIYSPSGQRHFGNYIYDQSTQKEFLDNQDSLTGSLDPEWWIDRRQNAVYDYTDFDDRIAYMSLGGPIPGLSKYRGTFFISSRVSQEAYTFPRPRDTRDLRNFMINSAFFPSQRMKLKIGGFYNHDAHSTLNEASDFTNQAKYYRGWGSILDTYTSSISLQFTHTLSQSLFYDLKLSRFHQKLLEAPSEFTVTGESSEFNIWGFDRFDGYPDEPFDAYTFIYDTHIETGDLSASGSVNWQANANNLIKTGFELRYNTVNEVRNYRLPSFTFNPDYHLNRGLHEKYHPIQFAGYIQDKMEFEGMILNLGVRYDFFDPNREWFVNENLFNLSIDPEFDAALDPDGDQVDSLGNVKYSFQNVLDKPRAPVDAYHMISPRLGVSFPVTERTVLHFNYGHFRQMPPLDRMFEFNYFRPEYIPRGWKAAADSSEVIENVASRDGDPERVVFLTLEPLKPEKTIQFEVGVKHHFEDLAVLTVTAFYKDVFDQNEPRVQLFDRRIYGYDPFNDQTTLNTFFVSNFPGDYGDSRGFELTLRTLFSDIVTFDVNYSFSRATEGRASPERIILPDSGEVEFVFDNEVTTRLLLEKIYSRPHVLRANLFLRYPEGGNGILSKLMEGISASLLYKLHSGPPLTYLSPTDPSVAYNNEAYPAVKTVDMRLEKQFHLGATNKLSAYVRVTNLFNTRNLRSFGDIFFDVNALSNYVEEGIISKEDGAGYDISYQTYHAPRRFYFGFTYGF